MCVEILLAGVQTACWGCAVTCRRKVSVNVQGHRHLVNKLQDQRQNKDQRQRWNRTLVYPDPRPAHLLFPGYKECL